MTIYLAECFSACLLHLDMGEEFNNSLMFQEHQYDTECIEVVSHFSFHSMNLDTLHASTDNSKTY